jgi:hypothetical protein
MSFIQRTSPFFKNAPPPVTFVTIGISDTGSGLDSLSLLNLVNLAELGLGWDAIAPLLLLEQFESISGWDQDQGTWQITNNELDPVSQNAPNWGGMVITKNVSYKDFDAYMRIKTPTDNKGVQFLFRTGSTEGSGYGLQLRVNDGNFRIENWGVANLSNVSFSYTNDTYYRVRVRVRGSNIKAKIWLDGSSEPTSWNIDFNDTTFPNAGKVGFSSENGLSWSVDWLIIESYDVNILGLIPVTDTGSGVDVIAILSQIALSDTSLGTDAVSTLAQIAISDSGSATEALSALITIALSDTGIGTEALSIVASLLLSDSGIGSETLSAVISFLISDSGSHSDVVNILAMVAVSDSAIANDTVTALVSLAISDSGSHSDVISILASIGISDSGIGDEILSILAQVNLSDNAQGIEVLQILNSFILSDSGLGIESLNILAQVAISDNGSISSEAISIIAGVAVSDSASATDALFTLTIVALSDSGIAQEAVTAGLASGLFARGSSLYDLKAKLYNKTSTGLYNKK